ncbi:leucyl aminopeptidase [Parerythrobacter aestuarii]|uniref:leucyl aminopeptidase n=1 Tax=Parerythrobacter aestuarii TaxID=3020909 RepID=UPI0024DE092B|nr:leucyl aminopeptidase [Parerythrobacter aestuarii]
MNITFADSLPSGASLIAHIVNRGALPDGLENVIVEGAKAARFKGGPGQVFEGFVQRGGKLVRVALSGTGENGADERSINCEKAGAALAAKYVTSGETSIVVDFTDSGLTSAEVTSVLLGLRLRCWRHDAYRTKLKEEQKKTLVSATVIGAPKRAEDLWETEAALCEGIEFARDLIAEPANILYPTSFVTRCRDALQGTGIEIVVLDEDEMEKLGMGALLGVGLGSEKDSRLLCMKWSGGETGQRPMAFVGKGVTFDTGGISIKPGPGMWDMKWDMGGAAAVAGAMVSIAKRQAKANIIGVCGLVENMPDGRAQRPGDIVTSMSGQTIEVLNTDAEGRLVLCDALTWVQKEFDPVGIVDFATLTGAMIVALGNEHGGLFANDDTLAEKLLSAGKSTGDKLWRFPLSSAYDKLIDSPIADMKNIGPRGAGSITAAQFLQRFVDKDRPWAHCDIAGMVFSEKAGQTWDKGATGYGVRIIDQYVRDVLEA